MQATIVILIVIAAVADVDVPCAEQIKTTASAQKTQLQKTLRSPALLLTLLPCN
jgi:hypothetical protein